MISIVAPIYNEEKNLVELHDALAAVVSRLEEEVELIFVNDGSSDDSAAILDKLAAGDRRVTVVHLKRNYGQTAAMMAGFDHATGEIIICLDGDLQNDPADIPRLLDKLAEGYDVVSGWRKNRKDAFLSRVFVSNVANSIISRVSGVHIHDYGCSLKAYRASVIKDVRLYGEMHRFIPIYARWQGARITELEVNHRPRVHGTSNYGIERVFKVLMDLIVVIFIHEYNQKPMYIFGAAGFLSFAIALGAGLLALYYKIIGAKDFIETPLPLLVALATITGFMCFLMGLLAELIVRTYFESQKKKTYTIGRVTRTEQ